ncbi:MAG: glutamine amidotransferase [Pseudomonadota bacterium]
MTQSLILDPLVPWPVLLALVGAALLFVALAVWRGLSGWWLRGLTAAVLLAALANPSLQTEQRAPQGDIVIVVVDDSASQGLGNRADQTARALAGVEREVASLPNTELRVRRVADGPDNAGTLAMTALAEAIAEEPRARIAGLIVISDGQVHDLGLVPVLPAPLHLLMTGAASDWDRRLVVKNAPAFAILGEEFMLTLKIEDQGAVPASAGAEVDLTIAVDSEPPQTYRVPVGQDLELPVTLPHGGMNVLQFSVPRADGELTDRNNTAAVQINGVRDRLRVLLVSGEPHAGERVWRNLLKSDASVDLVHFTILRPPEKQDGIPVDELSLIAFPTRELFIEKIEEFDLIIFDRYRMRGILPMSYLDNVVNYVRKGGTVLVAAGPEFGAVDSLYRSPLADILPVEPTAQVIEQGFRPALTDLGRRHPVTEGLEALAPAGGWGRWFRLIEVTPKPGAQVVMSGPGNRPLLVLNREGEGRVAVLASDQAWLWGRGYEGGGPQLELLRRLAHWMLKQPELEEEALTATVKDEAVTITRRTVAEVPPGPVTITGPDGVMATVDMTEAAPGRFEAVWAAPGLGLYRMEQGDLARVIAVGPASPKEFEATIASDAGLAPIVSGSRGGVVRIEDGLPDIRTVRDGRPAAGRGWIGIAPRGAYVTEDIDIAPLVPAWLALLLAVVLAIAAWLYEGRRGRPTAA